MLLEVHPICNQVKAASSRESRTMSCTKPLIMPTLHSDFPMKFSTSAERQSWARQGRNVFTAAEVPALHPVFNLTALSTQPLIPQLGHLLVPALLRADSRNHIMCKNICDIQFFHIYTLLHKEALLPSGQGLPKSSSPNNRPSGENQRAWTLPDVFSWGRYGLSAHICECSREDLLDFGTDALQDDFVFC